MAIAGIRSNGAKRASELNVGLPLQDCETGAACNEQQNAGRAGQLNPAERQYREAGSNGRGGIDQIARFMDRDGSAQPRANCAPGLCSDGSSDHWADRMTMDGSSSVRRYSRYVRTPRPPANTPAWNALRSR